VGDIKDRQAAREVYEQAKANGRKATLMEQERPNIFTNSVANIGPHETVVVQIEYQEPVRQSANEFSLRVPLVVAPRYNPAPTAEPRGREIIYVIDNSGSMGGTSIIQAKASLTYALGRLKAGDRFNVIRFDHAMDVLFPDTVAADAEHVAQAKAFVAALQARG